MRPFCLSLLIIILTSIILNAQTAFEDTVQTIIVTAERRPTPENHLINSYSILEKDQLKQQVSRSMAEALIGSPGVWMQKTNHGGGSPFVRGLTGNQTLLLLDGIRLNNATYRYGPNQYFNTIDVLNVRQVEVLSGSGSVLYGSDALGGTINVLSNQAQFSANKNQFNGGLMGRLISNGMEQSGRAHVQFSSKNSALRVGTSQRNFGELITGGDRVTLEASDYKESSYDASFKQKLGKRAILQLSYLGTFQNDIGRNDQITQRGFRVYEFDPQNRQLGYARLFLQGSNKWLEQIIITTSLQSSKEVRRRQRENETALSTETDEVATIGMTAQMNSVFSENWRSTTGIEMYHDDVSSARQIEDNGAVNFVRGLYPDGALSTSWALFHQQHWEKNKVSILAGIRYQRQDIEMEDVTFGKTEITPDAIVWNVNAAYKIHPQGRFIAAIQRSFRAPNINDLSSFGSFDFGVEVPSTDLSPETSIGLDLGYVLHTANTQFSIFAYQTHLQDLIVRQAATFNGSTTFEGEDVYKKVNRESALIQGFEAQWRQSLQQWHLQTYLAYTHGQEKDSEKALRRIPPFNGGLILGYVPAGWNVQLQNQFALAQRRLSGGDISDHRIPEGGTDGWYVLHLNIGKTWNQWSVYGGIQNIFNSQYRIHGSGVDGAGRHVWLRMDWHF